MNIGAERLAAVLTKFAKQGKEVNIWRQFGEMLASSPPYSCTNQISLSLDIAGKPSVALWFRGTDLSVLAVTGYMTMDVVGTTAFG